MNDNDFLLSLIIIRIIEKATDFCMLIFILLHFQKCWSDVRVFVSWWCPQDLLNIGFYHLQIGIILLLPFLFVFLLYFFCHISLAKNLNTVLNKSREIGHFCPIPGFIGNGFSFSHLVLCWLYVYHI
jgi:hypothetical protein